MYKKLLRITGLLGFKVKTCARTKPDNCTYGTVMTSWRASEITAGAPGMSSEVYTTYRRPQ